MKKDSNILLKLVFPVFILGFIAVAQTQAADNTGKNVNRINDMPSAPVGPYRSTHNFNKTSSVKQLDSRQWTPPAPSHWVQQQKHSAVSQHDTKIKNKKPPLQQSMPTTQAVVRPFKNKQWSPPIPPQWVQQRRQMQQPVPPQWVQQRRQMRVYPSVSPQWTQPQHRQMQYYPLIPPPWVQQQRRQVPVYPSSPFPWRQQRAVTPNFYNYPPAWGRAPYPQYRRY